MLYPKCSPLKNHRNRRPIRCAISHQLGCSWKWVCPVSYWRYCAPSTATDWDPDGTLWPADEPEIVNDPFYIKNNQWLFFNSEWPFLKYSEYPFLKIVNDRSVLKNIWWPFFKNKNKIKYWLYLDVSIYQEINQENEAVSTVDQWELLVSIMTILSYKLSMSRF